MRKLIILLGTALLLAITWMLLASTGDYLPSEEGTDGLELESIELAGSEISSESSSEEDVQAGRSILADHGVPDEAYSARYRIRVVEKASGEAVAGAHVFFLSDYVSAFYQLTEEEKQDFMLTAFDMERLSARFGTEAVSDSDGYLTALGRGESKVMQLSCRHGGLYGQLVIDVSLNPGNEDRVFDLELEEDQTLRVQVLDSSGNPALGVPVALGKASHVGTLGTQGRIGLTKSPDGMVSVPHIQSFRSILQSRGEFEAQYQVQALIPGLSGRGLLFDFGNPPVEPLVLKLPPTGSILLETRDVAGKLVSAQISGLSLSQAPDDDPAPGSLSTMNSSWRVLPRDDGRIFFPHVVTGVNFVASANLNRELLKKTFPGPTRHGDQVEVTLAPTSLSYNLVGRVLYPDGEAVANARLSVLFERASGRKYYTGMSADLEGRFILPIAKDKVDPVMESLTLTLERELPLEIQSKLGVTLRRRIPLLLGDNDVGELVLGSNPSLASGRVSVDGRAAKRRTFPLILERLRTYRHSKGTAENWSNDQALTVKYSEGGRFEVRGEATPERMRISMSRNYERIGHGGRLDYLPFEPVEFAQGDKDIEIALQTGGNLRVNLLLDEDVPLDHILLRLEPQDAETRAAAQQVEPRRIFPGDDRLNSQQALTMDDRPAFIWGALWPGTYSLDIRPRGARQPLVRIDDIVIEAGEQTRDPRLESIDLREKLRVIEIRLRDVDGRPLLRNSYGRPQVIINDPTAEKILQAYAAEDSVARIITAEAALDLLAVARGYRPVELFGVSADRDVVMESFPEVVLRIEGGLPEMPAGYGLKLSLRRLSQNTDRRRIVSDKSSGGSVGDFWQPPGGSFEVDAKGEARIQVGEAGAYRVRVFLHDREKNHATAFRGLEPQNVEVKEQGGDEQIFEFALSGKAIEAAIEAAIESARNR